MHTSPSTESMNNIVIHNGIEIDKSTLTSRELKRLELEIAVSLFENSGNKIQEIPQGYSYYRDGKIPNANTGPYKETSNEEINEKNERAKALRLERNAKQKQQNAASNTVKTTKPKKQFNTRSPEEAERRKKVSDARKEAELNGAKSFIAPCREHGDSKYVFYSETIKCVKCLEARRKRGQKNKVGDPQEAERKATISERRLAAMEAGETTFTGICRIHKETPYHILNSGHSRCTACRDERAQAARDSKKTPEQLFDAARKKRNKAALKKALEAGEIYFMAECVNCKLTKFRVKTLAEGTPKESKLYYCVACNEARYKNKNAEKKDSA